MNREVDLACSIGTGQLVGVCTAHGESPSCCGNVRAGGEAPGVFAGTQAGGGNVSFGRVADDQANTASSSIL